MLDDRRLRQEVVVGIVKTTGTDFTETEVHKTFEREYRFEEIVWIYQRIN